MLFDNQNNIRDRGRSFDDLNNFTANTSLNTNVLKSPPLVGLGVGSNGLGFSRY